ncbi:high mobility group B protein 15 [Punica granatum]|uniref:High mobility group B protein 15 n=2 Tax=Punica granatum TaxID=22663 RepID=A0A6P8CDA4_PUNGR|nr:high mobility group B protein 15 [Punica granatum]XP_031378983.1 high mobility group B protein 15 [Punica granatum]PKI75063.1 hypothetical protein CRG98_004537 [Punica granatum]
MASSSRASQSQTIGMGMRSEGNYQAYPPPVAEYSQVVASPQLFMSTLEKLHSTMGTKFMIPIIGGKELDLHRLFVEVTSRGGIEKIIRERRWKDVTATFNFPSTATNASFVLRKYYVSLLQHYEQIYFFRARGWTPMPAGNLQSPPLQTLQFQRIEPAPTPQASRPTLTQQMRMVPAELPRALSLTNSAGTPVVGVIDGKFEDGYLVTVSLGPEKLKGVLYQIPQDPSQKMPQHQSGGFKINDRGAPAASVTVHRRRRRKKSEIKRRDPAHPKPNRSGYNFFFAEQHARLKPLHPGKDREISRMIGELWNKLKETERAVYQEKAMKDKERYKAEMENYRERLRLGQVISDAVPLQQRLPELDVEMAEADTGTEEAEEESPHTPYNESSTGKSNSEEFKEAEASLVSGAAGESSNENMDTEGPAGPKSASQNPEDKVEKGKVGNVDVGPEAANAEGQLGKVERDGEGIDRSMEMKKECEGN